MNLFNLIATISLDDDKFKDGLSKSEKSMNAFKSGLGKIGDVGVKAMKGLATSVAIASASIGALTKVSIDSYAEFEQLTGGVETLFKDSADTIFQYSQQAYKTAGLSANEYMSTIVGFSASLIQSLGGDTVKASEIGNQAILDMSDNANKMGTSMEMIQNAYQGFAKQNYTMLDNLKLGYGGTKEEMERLLADASKLSGIEYKISNFSDIIEAIHVIQTELDITGTTAKEASTTIEGSFNSMKSAWSNLMTAFADDNADFDKVFNELMNSAMTFGDNIIPRIEIVLSRVGDSLPKIINAIVGTTLGLAPQLLDSGVKAVGSLFDGLMKGLPQLINAGVDIIKTIIDSITTALPNIISSASEIMGTLINAIIETLPMLLQLGFDVLLALADGIIEALPTLVPTVLELIVTICDNILENLPLILNAGMELLIALTEGIVNSLPILIQDVPRIINTFMDVITQNLPKIIETGVTIIVMLIKGLIDSIPLIVENLPQIIMAIINVFTMVQWASIGKSIISNIGQGIMNMKGNIVSQAKTIAENVMTTIKNLFSGGGSLGKNFITNISSGIKGMVGTIVSTARNMASNVLNTIKNTFSWENMTNIGKNLVEGIWNGISNVTGWIISKIGGFTNTVLKSIKGFFGIHSPSRVMANEVGKFLPQGIAVGFEKELPEANEDIEKSLSTTVDVTKKALDGVEGGTSQNIRTVTRVLEVPISIDGREFMRATAEYQDEYDDYNSRSPVFA